MKPRIVDKPGEMCSYDPKTGTYSGRWLWEEILGEDFSQPTKGTPGELVINWDPNTPIPVEPKDDE